MAVVEVHACPDVADETNNWVQGPRVLIGVGGGDLGLVNADFARWWILNLAGYVCDRGPVVTYTRDFEP